MRICLSHSEPKSLFVFVEFVEQLLWPWKGIIFSPENKHGHSSVVALACFLSFFLILMILMFEPTSKNQSPSLSVQKIIILYW